MNKKESNLMIIFCIMLSIFLINEYLFSYEIIKDEIIHHEFKNIKIKPYSSTYFPYDLSKPAFNSSVCVDKNNYCNFNVSKNATINFLILTADNFQKYSQQENYSSLLSFKRIKNLQFTFDPDEKILYYYMFDNRNNSYQKTVNIEFKNIIECEVVKYNNFFIYLFFLIILMLCILYAFSNHNPINEIFKNIVNYSLSDKINKYQSNWWNNLSYKYASISYHFIIIAPAFLFFIILIPKGIKGFFTLDTMYFKYMFLDMCIRLFFMMFLDIIIIGFIYLFFLFIGFKLSDVYYLITPDDEIFYDGEIETLKGKYFISIISSIDTIIKILIGTIFFIIGYFSNNYIIYLLGTSYYAILFSMLIYKINDLNEVKNIDNYIIFEKTKGITDMTLWIIVFPIYIYTLIYLLPAIHKTLYSIFILTLKSRLVMVIYKDDFKSLMFFDDIIFTLKTSLLFIFLFLSLSILITYQVYPIIMKKIKMSLKIKILLTSLLTGIIYFFIVSIYDELINIPVFNDDKFNYITSIIGFLTTYWIGRLFEKRD